MTERELRGRTEQCYEALAELMASPLIAFSDLTPSKLPAEPGLYVITDHAGQVLRAGRTDKQTLQDRVYRNHLMGSQSGNLPAQLTAAAVCEAGAAKSWIRANCLCQVIEESRLKQLDLELRWIEHFMLGVLRPRFCN